MLSRKLLQSLLLGAAVGLTAILPPARALAAAEAPDHEAAAAPAAAEGREPGSGAAEAQEEDEHSAVITAGRVNERELKDHATLLGTSVSVELPTPEKYLKVELGETEFVHDGSDEWESKLIFKIPFELAPRTELLVGLGPTWSHNDDPAERKAMFGSEATADLFYWFTRSFALFAAPAYGYELSKGSQHGASITLGIAIGVP